MASRWPTAGERLVERELKKERRAGVTHYRTGQHHARLVPGEGDDGDWYELTYVNAMGHAVMLPAFKNSLGGFEAMGIVVGAGQSHVFGAHRLAEDFKLTPQMLEALRVAAGTSAGA